MLFQTQSEDSLPIGYRVSFPLIENKFLRKFDYRRLPSRLIIHKILLHLRIPLLPWKTFAHGVAFCEVGSIRAESILEVPVELSI